MAPSGPGLYAWYAMPKFGSSDAANEQTVRDILLEFSGKLTQPPVALHGRSSYQIRFGGSLNEELGEKLATALGRLDGRPGSGLASEKQRAAMLTALPHLYPA